MHKLSAKDNENFEYLKQKIGQKLAPFKQKVYFRTKIKRKKEMELTGKVIAVLEPRGGVSKTGNAWKVQEYVIETHEQYPRKMCFDVFGEDKINQFNIQAGEELTVSFDIDAREWQGRWFNSIRAWKVERVAAQQSDPTGGDVPFPPMNAAPVDFSAGDEKDDLPF